MIRYTWWSHGDHMDNFGVSVVEFQMDVPAVTSLCPVCEFFEFELRRWPWPKPC
jgi:hypothetical protein